MLVMVVVASQKRMVFVSPVVRICGFATTIVFANFAIHSVLAVVTPTSHLHHHAFLAVTSKRTASVFHPVHFQPTQMQIGSVNHVIPNVLDVLDRHLHRFDSLIRFYFILSIISFHFLLDL